MASREARALRASFESEGYRQQQADGSLVPPVTISAAHQDPTGMLLHAVSWTVRRQFHARPQMADITVVALGESQYRVTVVDGRHRTTHVVTATANDVQHYAPPDTAPERLIAASFEFLLEREPASAILSSFALPVIERYFPEYPAVIRQRL
jgi:hypothetical protein